MKKTILNEKEALVVNHLPLGVNGHHPSCKELEQLTGLNIRTLSALISHLIVVHEIPIVAPRSGEQKGYFIASSRSEAEEYGEPLRQQGISIQNRYNKVIDTNFAELKGLLNGVLNDKYVMND